MASTSTTAMSAPSLPTKKRKASFGNSSAASSAGGEETNRKIRLEESVSSDVPPANNNNNNSSSSTLESRLPSKKRKGSHDSAAGTGASAGRKGSNDLTVSFEDGFRARKGSIDSSSNLLPLDAASPRKFSDGSSTVKLLDDLSFAPETLSFKGSSVVDGNATVDGTLIGTGFSASASILAGAPIATSALDHLDALGNSSNKTTSSTEGLQNGANLKPAALRKEDDNDSGSSATFASSNQRLLLEALRMTTTANGSNSQTATGNNSTFERSSGRDRLESWGGMSDLSFPLGSSENTNAVAMAASALQHSALLDDAMGGLGGLEDSKPAAVPSRISLERGRLNSVASEISGFNLALGLDGVDIGMDVQAYVAAAMASVGDQLAELAGAVELAASSADPTNLEESKKDMGAPESDVSSAASPIIGALSDGAGARRSSRRQAGRERSNSTSSGKISVDYEAVQAAVSAAEAATGSLDLSELEKMAPPPDVESMAYHPVSRQRKLRRQLPLKRNRTESQSGSSSTSDQLRGSLSEHEKERIRERAREAAGYVPKKALAPIKKRARRSSPEPERAESSSPVGTPKQSNKTARSPSDVPHAPLTQSSMSAAKAKGQASQKWEGMFECLLEFVEERRQEETKDLPDEEKDVWIWDGNVPTTYKTRDGKALGRWVNNQRSAKSKGTLKDDREQRLVDAGLKWSVMASNSWNQMLDELGFYVKEQTKDGKEWDGNVPTNYQIKTRPDSHFAGEDKNLGRWVNRQRSLFQAGKLREDRQLSLEKIGLKWSMLATTSWDVMYDTLLVYIAEQKKKGTDWDGNVPANYKTNDDPPRALGRWINRQRSAFMKNKLKKECSDKLTSVGLKWSVHQRQGDDGDGDDDSEADCPAPDSGVSGEKENKTGSSVAL